MIIRKKNIPNKKSSTSSSQNVSSKSSSKRNVIKKEDVAILDVEKARNTNETIEEAIQSKPQELPSQKISEEEEFEKIDISMIEFKERVERRRGDRRRGYRRIDERSLVTRAQQEAHTIKELAAREGYKNGFAEAQGQLDDIRAKLADFIGMRDEMYEEFYPHVMEIAMDITKKIIKKETEMSNDILKEIFASVIDELNSDTQRLEIKVNPQDYDFALVSLPEVVKEKNIEARVIFSQDESIDKGSCIVIANNGVIDANIRTQLAVLQNAFGIYKGGL